MPKRNILHDVFLKYDLTGGKNDNQIHPELCWPWRIDKYALNGKNQPVFSYRGKSYYAYRVVYHVSHPDAFSLDDPRVIRHVVCNNNLCGNFNHMEPGTQQDNMNDAVRDSRFGLTKEALSDIIEFLRRVEIGELDLTHERIAERVSFKHQVRIARSTVTDINTGRRNARRKEQRDA